MDRHRARAGGGVGRGAGVQRQGVEAGVGVAGHGRDRRVAGADIVVHPSAWPGPAGRVRSGAAASESDIPIQASIRNGSTAAAGRSSP